MLLLLCALGRASLGAAGAAVSANGGFAVELSRTPEEKLLVGVFEVAKEHKTLSWSRAVEWQFDNQRSGSVVYEVRPHVTGDDEKVILREYYRTTTNGLKIVGRRETDLHQVQLFLNTELIGSEESGQWRSGTTYRGVQCLVDSILDDDSSYAVWFGPTDKWLTLSLDTYEFGVASSRTNSHLPVRVFRFIQLLLATLSSNLA